MSSSECMQCWVREPVITFVFVPVVEPRNEQQPVKPDGPCDKQQPVKPDGPCDEQQPVKVDGPCDEQ